MTCSWASRLISPVVDDSDDKTTTFTLLLFNFYLFPQALLSITDFSQPLSVFLSVHLSFPFSSPLLSSPGAFCLFIPPCHELTTFFLSHCVFYMSLHFSSLFVPSQFPHGLLSLSLSPSCETNTFPSVSIHLCPFLPCSILCLSLHHSLYLSLPLLFSIFDPDFLSFGILHALLLILTSPFWYSFTFSPHLAEQAFAFAVHIFSSLLRLSCRDKSASSAFSSLWYFFCTLQRGIIKH